MNELTLPENKAWVPMVPLSGNWNLYQIWFGTKWVELVHPSLTPGTWFEVTT